MKLNSIFFYFLLIFVPLFIMDTIVIINMIESKNIYNNKYLFFFIIFKLVFIILISYLTSKFIVKKNILSSENLFLSKQSELIANLSNNIFIIYSYKRIIYTNKVFFDFFISKNDLKDLNLIDYIVDNKNINSVINLKKLLEDGSTLILQFENKQYNIKKHFEVSMHIVNSDFYMFELKDVDCIIEKRNELEEKANFDKLTKLYNRYPFEELFKEKYTTLKKNDNKRNSKIDLSLIMFDIDNFKKVNDTYGHDIGDKTLIFVSTIIKKWVRSSDIVCRWGGEEFIILIEENISNAIKTAENLRNIFESDSINNTEIPNFTCSFGIVNVNDHESIEESLKAVDLKLYESKHTGKNKLSY